MVFCVQRNTGLVANLPYVALAALDLGPVRALLQSMWQALCGSLMFYIFRMNTTAHYFTGGMQYGGARWVRTCHVGSVYGISL